jgi:hypothetical protein
LLKLPRGEVYDMLRVKTEKKVGVTELVSKQSSNFIAAIAVEGEQNAVDYCGDNGNFLPYSNSVIFILFTVHYYFDT